MLGTDIYTHTFKIPILLSFYLIGDKGDQGDTGMPGAPGILGKEGQKGIQCSLDVIRVIWGGRVALV